MRQQTCAWWYSHICHESCGHMCVMRHVCDDWHMWLHSWHLWMYHQAQVCCLIISVDICVYTSCDEWWVQTHHIFTCVCMICITQDTHIFTCDECMICITQDIMWWVITQDTSYLPMWWVQALNYMIWPAPGDTVIYVMNHAVIVLRYMRRMAMDKTLETTDREREHRERESI